MDDDGPLNQRTMPMLYSKHFEIVSIFGFGTQNLQSLTLDKGYIDFEDINKG